MNSIGTIEHSSAFQGWREAFLELTGIEIHLLDGASLDHSLCRAARSTMLCRLLCGRCDQCDQCRKRFAQRLRTEGSNHAGPFAMRCFAGLTVTALPVRLADGSTAFLYSGPVFLKGNSGVGADQTVAGRVGCNGNGLSGEQIRRAAREVPVGERRKFRAAITLGRLLADQLSHTSRRMLAVPERGRHEAYVIRRACELIDGRFTENLHLDEVVREIGVSRSYLSHLFTSQMGLSFTDYLAGRRVTEVKRLLVDSELSITEVLFASGFQSVSQGNRVFRSSTGMAPRQFRARRRA